MANLSDWQWAVISTGVLTALIVGGWFMRRHETEAEDHTPPNLNEIEELQQQLALRDSELNEAREEAELTLLQLHQVQEELEQLILQNQTQARDSELNELNELRKQLQARDSELKDAQEEAELTLLQLHQVQEELEYYFLESRKQVSSQALTSAQLDQLQRIKQRLIHQLKVSPTQDNPAFRKIIRRQQNALRRFQRLHQAH